MNADLYFLHLGVAAEQRQLNCRHSVIICGEDTSLPLEVIDLTRSSSDGNGVYIESYGRICR